MTTYTDDENQWNFTAKSTGYTKTAAALELAFEPDISSISTEYTPDEITAHELFQVWVKRAEQRHGDIIPIYWYVAGPGDAVFEQAPFCTAGQKLGEKYESRKEDFLSFYTRPVHAETGAPINWARLPIPVGTWAPGSPVVSKCDYIVNATGWMPAPLQPSVSLAFLKDCANAQQAISGD
ncbi:hypothetical protein IU451_28740 [Nocardia cyriacigeorgica]|uniref:hypothetical protein n=1 Tax=Nocardia cyriacigeorgica TaxID=135487 RepID=UPI0018932528|nr:hypothetical protein [Nocardia cyriacigeorgica]MBF6326490.1 hypothetical protein [Nocardia cyriacigeorgica]